MTIRNAIGQSKILAFGLLLVGGWTIVQLLNVVNLTESFTTLGVPFLSGGTPVGRAAGAGIMGVLVMLGFLGLLVVLWGELGEFDPGPVVLHAEEGNEVQASARREPAEIDPDPMEIPPEE